MGQTAFELRSELVSGKKEDRFAGGSVTVNGEHRDLTELLGKDGKVVLDDDTDARLIAALDGHPALKRATVNGSAKAEAEEG